MPRATLSVEKCQSAYQDLSSVAGQTVRQAGYAGIALIWALKDDHGIPPALRGAGVLLFFALGMDMLTYIVPSYIWAIYGRYMEHSINKDKQAKPEFLAPVWINFPYMGLSALRYVAIILAYVAIISFLIKAYFG